MSTQLQQVLQRLYLISPTGKIYRPRERVLAVLNVIAGAIKHDAPERGAWLTISAISARCKKGRRTVQMAIKEAITDGMLWIATSKRSSGKQAPSFYYINSKLCDASEKAKPYLGEMISFMSRMEPPKPQGGNLESRTARAKLQHQKIAAKSVVRTEKTRVQLLHSKYIGVTPPEGPPTERFAWLKRLDKPRVASPARPLGGAGGVPVPTREDLETFFGPDAIVFFDWLSTWDVTLRVDYQVRLKSADRRGAPLGTAITKKNWRCNARAALEGLFLLAMALGQPRGKSPGKTKLEGVVAGVGDHPILLVDDLTLESSKELELWWPGAMALIETSQNNFQALLIASRSLTEGERLSAQRVLAQKFDGDTKAITGTQLHRYPGSMNYKQGASWRTKLAFVRQAERDVSNQLLQLLEIKRPPQTQIGGQKSVNQKSDNSSEAFRWTLASLRRRVPEARIIEGLMSEYNPDGKHSRGGDHGLAWAQRTLGAARLRMHVAEK
jgi:hypothetical protein